MALLHNPHPGEIPKAEFLGETGMSQNQLASAIGVPANRIHAIIDGTPRIALLSGRTPLPQLTTIAMVASHIERGGRIETEQRFYICSRALSATEFAEAARGHWAIENNLHWILDVTFHEDQSRLCIGDGVNSMAVVRHFARNLLRQAVDQRSIKR